jgi:uncharacterized membrane protein YgdD (TMEM256/DUF423 family)
MTATADRFALRVAAIFGALGVGLGAFGAHGLSALLERNQRVDTWETAVLYHLVHAVVLLALALHSPRRGPFLCFAIGILIFSGTLYVLSLTNATWLGAITPLGGVAFIVGWVWLAVGKK